MGKPHGVRFPTCRDASDGKSVFWTALVAISMCKAQTSSNGVKYNIDFTKFPGCGLVCMIHTAPAAGCAISDIGCMCQSQKMIDTTTTCLLANCTLDDGFSVLREQAKVCNYNKESKNKEVRVVVLTFASITKFVIPLRLVLRYLSQAKFGWDDWFVLAAFFTDTTAFYAAMKLINNGLGEHIWNVTPSELNQLVLWAYVVLCTYVVSNGLIKISVLSFYLRIFTVHKYFRYLCFANIFFCASTAITFLFTTIFQCIPVSNAFMLLPQDGYCLNSQAAIWTHAALTVLQDTLVLVLPIMEVRALQMSLRRKIGVSLIFILGGLVVIASIVRMSALKKFGRTSDPTWSNQPTVVWSSIELGTGLICACVPSIYSGIRQLWPGIRTFTQRYVLPTTTSFSSSFSSRRKNKEDINSSKDTNSSSESGHSGRSDQSNGQLRAYQHHKNNNMRHTASQKRRYRHESMDLPLTEIITINDDEEAALHECELLSSPPTSMTGTRRDEKAEDRREGSPRKSGVVPPVDYNKPHPPLPVMASASVSTSGQRGKGSGKDDWRWERERERQRERSERERQERESQERERLEREKEKERQRMGGIEAVTTVTIVNQPREKVEQP